MELLTIVGAAIVSYCGYLALLDDAHDRAQERKQRLPLFTKESILGCIQQKAALLADKWRGWTARNVHVTRLHQAIDSATRLSGPYYLLLRQPLPVRVTERYWQERR